MKRLLKSVSIAMLAQIVSLCLSVFMSFYVSKYMSIKSYGYYQLFLFYSTYVGILQFGTSEGIYLLNGGKEYKDIDKEKMLLLFRNVFFIMISFSIIILPLIHCFVNDDNKKFVCSIILIYAIVYFCVTYFGYILQAVKRITYYSSSIIAGKIFTLAAFLILVANEIFEYQIYCVIYLGGYLLSSIIIMYNCRDILFTKVKNAFVIFENKEVIIAGCSLLFANLVSSFIVGINRVYIEENFGIEIFGKVSMALSLANFMILFAIQMGLVFFPNIVNLSQESKIRVYKLLEKVLKALALLIFIAYIPLQMILDMWIPQYMESIRWMLLLVPYAFYEIKNQIIYITYIKVLREEKYMLKTNILAMLMCVVVNFFMVFYLKNLEIVFVVLNISVICKALLLNKKICQKLNVKYSCINILEACVIMAISILMYYNMN